MKRFQWFALLFGVLTVAAFTARAMAQEPPDGPPPHGGPGGPGGFRGGPGGPGGPDGGFHLFPRFVAEKLELTADQQKQLARLEKETKAKLEKILTPQQRRILEQARPRPGQDGPGAPESGRRGPGGARRGPGSGPGGPGDGPGPGRGGPGGPDGPGGPTRPARPPSE